MAGSFWRIAVFGFVERVPDIGRRLDAAADHFGEKVDIIVRLARHLFANFKENL